MVNKLNSRIYYFFILIKKLLDKIIKNILSLNDHIQWTINDWKRVLWSYESKYNLKIRKPKGKHLTPKYTRRMVKHGGGKGAMVWGCFSSFSGVRSIHRINVGTIFIADYNPIIVLLMGRFGVAQENNAKKQ